MNTDFPHIQRRFESILLQRMQEEACIVLEGPRSVGKSTLLRQIGEHYDVPVFDLDSPSMQSAVQLDPEQFAGRARPVLIDEYQKAPTILDAIKAELNKGVRPGQFVLTGSAHQDYLTGVAQALTGRVHRMSIDPFAQAELDNADVNFVRKVLADPDSLYTSDFSTTDRAEYERRILAGGLPLAVSRTAKSRHRWFDDYLLQTLRRDVADVSDIKRADALPALLNRLAGQTAQVLNTSRIAESIGLHNSMTARYIEISKALFLVRELPAWAPTLTSRSAKKSKIHMIDSGLAAHLLGVTAEKLARLDGTAMTEFGHLLESFVFGELVRHAAWTDEPLTFGHWRDHDRHEVDMVIEHGDGRIVAIEVKASRRVEGKDVASLAHLQRSLGSHAGYTGILFHLGEARLRMAPGILALPLDVLWTS